MPPFLTLRSARLWGICREWKAQVPAALEFLILTAARTGEVIGARWSQIDFKDKVWIVPAARMKSGREHRVPLSSAAITVLQPNARRKG